MTKRKEERRELLKEDDIHSFLERSARYIQQNVKQVGAIAAVALVLLAGFSLWIQHLEDKRDEQAQVLYKAEKILATNIDDEKSELKFSSEKEKFEKALVELDEVIANQSGIVKQQAVVRKIGVLINLGRHDEVESLYQELINDSGLKAFGHMGLGDFYLERKEYGKAREHFNELMGLRGVPEMADLVRYKLAVCYKAENDLSNAKSELSQVINAYENEEDAAKKPPIFTKAEQLMEEIDKEAGAGEVEAS